ncbi:MAG: SdrD B-like domain-containing protein [Isosphaeraceae bacterium]
MPGATSTFTFLATPTAATDPGDVLTNSATASGSSLPGNPGPISPYNPSSTPRTDSSTGTADVTLNSNQLSGTVYLDVNDNGVQDPGEPGLAGVTVTLTGTPNFGSFATITVNTDGSGHYSFSGIPAGSYTITEDRSSLGTRYKGTDRVGTQGTADDPAGTFLPPILAQPATSAIVDIRFLAGASVDGRENDFAELPSGSLAGTVYVDINNTGRYDPATDPPLPGVTVTLTGIDYLGDPVSIQTTTGGDGSYRFTGLAPGTYSLHETQPEGYAQGTDSVGTLGGNALLSVRDTVTTIVVGALNRVQPLPSMRYDGTGYDFGELIRADNQMIKSASTLVPPLGTPFTLGLTVINKGPSLSEGTVVTDPIDPSLVIDPAWLAEPPPGVSFAAGVLRWEIGDLPVNAIRNLAVPVSVVGFPAGPIVNEATVTSTTIELNPADNASHVVLTPSSILSGVYFLDYDANGAFDGYDLPLGGQALTLSGGGGGPFQVQTDPDGFYLFPNVPEGTWTITASPPAGATTFFQSIPGVLIDASGNLTPSGVAVGQEITEIQIPLTPVQVGVGYNFAALPLGQISGAVREASNGTTPGVLPIPGGTITLTGTTFDGSPVSTSQTTGPDGAYAFTGLVPGTYQLAEAQPTGYLQGLIEVGSQGGVASPPADSILQILIGPPSLFTQVPPNKPDFDPSIPEGTYSSAENNFSEYRLIDLEILKAVDEAHPEVGDAVTYTVTVRNIGPGVATGVRAVDLFPSGMTLVSANPDLGSYDPDTGTWTIGELKGTVDFPGETAPDSATLILVAIVPPPVLPLTAPYVLTNRAIVSGNEREITYVNNEADASINPLLCDLVVLKSVDNPTPSRGDEVTFTIDLSNVGPDGTDGVRLDDILPDGLIYVPGSAQPSIGSFDPLKGLWTVGILPAGETATLVFQAVVDTYDPVVNLADAYGSTVTETDLTNNQSSVELAPLQPALEIRKAVIQNPTPHAGQDVVYDITLLNNGLGSATGVTVEESMPNSLSFVSYAILDSAGNPVEPPSGGRFDPSTGVWEVGTVRTGDGFILRMICRMEVSPQETVINTASIKDPNSTSVITEAEGAIAPLGIISGRLFWDANLDGKDSPDDPGLAGVSVLLTGLDPSGRPISASATTDGRGNYAFRDLTPGSWTVSVLAAPGGYLREVVLPGPLGGTATADAVTGIPMSGSLIAIRNDFGFIRASELSGYVVWDLDHDLVRGSADFGLANVTMTLRDRLPRPLRSPSPSDQCGGLLRLRQASRRGRTGSSKARRPRWSTTARYPGRPAAGRAPCGARPGRPGRTVPNQVPRSIYDIALAPGIDGREYDIPDSEADLRPPGIGDRPRRPGPSSGRGPQPRPPAVRPDAPEPRPGPGRRPGARRARSRPQALDSEADRPHGRDQANRRRPQPAHRAADLPGDRELQGKRRSSSNQMIDLPRRTRPGFRPHRQGPRAARGDHQACCFVLANARSTESGGKATPQRPSDPHGRSDGCRIFKESSPDGLQCDVLCKGAIPEVEEHSRVGRGLSLLLERFLRKNVDQLMYFRRVDLAQTIDVLGRVGDPVEVF